MLPRRNVAAALLVMASCTAALGEQLNYPLLDYSHAMAVHRRVEQWVKDARINADEPPIFVSGCVGLKVTLRWDGTLIGEGQWTGPLDQTSIDLIHGAQLATNAALARVRERHKRSQGKAGNTLTDITARLTVDVQVARQVEPIVLAGNAKKNAAMERFASGYHGLLMIPPPGTPGTPGTPGSPGSAAAPARMAWMWPGDAIARNMSPKVQLLSLLSKLKLQRKLLPQVGKTSGPQLGRFEVLHIVRPQRHQPVARLVRGNVLLPPIGLDEPTLEALASRLAAHLRRRQRQDGTMAGRFMPTRDQYVQVKASPFEQALTVYALARWAKLSGENSVMNETLLATHAAVSRAAQHLGAALIMPLSQDDTAACALTLMALVDCPPLVDRKALRQAMRRRLVERQNKDGSFRSAQADDAPVLAPAVRVLPLLALAKLYEQSGDEALLAPIRLASQWLDGAGESGEMATHAWWYQANTVLRRIGERAADADDKLMRRAAEALLKKQVVRTSDDTPADVIGGFNFAGPDQRARPDWSTAYGVLMLASTLDRDLGDQQTPIILAAALGARFLAQLMFDEPGFYYIRSTEDVAGGVRNSLSDNELAPPATALALLAITQLQHGLRHQQVPKQ